MRLSKRLEVIVAAAARATEGICAADVGTDHGFVPICLVDQGIVRRALAMDVRKGPLERARNHIARHGLEEQIETRLSDGLAALKPGEADTVIIAGMGGELMLRILEEGGHVRESIRHWILSPQSEPALVRHGLERLGLAVQEEVMLEEEGKYYTVMTVEPGPMHYAEEYQYRYGDCLIRSGSETLGVFLEQEEKQLKQICLRLEKQLEEPPEEQLEQENRERICLRLEQLREEIHMIKEAYHAMFGTDGPAE